MNSHRLTSKQEKLLQQWWHCLQPRDAADERDAAATCGPFLSLGRGERAALRRCSNPAQVMCEPAFLQLMFHWTQGNEGAPDGIDMEAAALAAGLVARVRARGTEQGTRPVAVLLGQGRDGGDTPLMSRLRFEQLLRSGDTEELFLRMRRALDMLDTQPIHITELADELLGWALELRGDVPPPAERIRVVWARRYFTEPLRQQGAGRTAAKSKPKAPASTAA